MVVVADVGTADEGVAAVRQHRPDVVLLDIRMPGKNGIELVRELRASDELPPTILLTTFDDDEALIDGVKAGARGFLLKDISLELLTAAIRGVASGENLIRPAITQHVLRGLGSDTTRDGGKRAARLSRAPHQTRARRAATDRRWL